MFATDLRLGLLICKELAAHNTHCSPVSLWGQGVVAGHRRAVRYRSLDVHSQYPLIWYRDIGVNESENVWLVVVWQDPSELPHGLCDGALEGERGGEVSGTFRCRLYGDTKMSDQSTEYVKHRGT